MVVKQKLIKVGPNSLMVIVPSKLCEEKKWKVGDIILCDFIKKVGRNVRK